MQVWWNGKNCLPAPSGATLVGALVLGSGLAGLRVSQSWRYHKCKIRQNNDKWSVMWMICYGRDGVDSLLVQSEVALDSPLASGSGEAGLWISRRVLPESRWWASSVRFVKIMHTCPLQSWRYLKCKICHSNDRWAIASVMIFWCDNMSFRPFGSEDMLNGAQARGSGVAGLRVSWRSLRGNI